ncbi:unnamed protein product, partial [Pleuronectes platessa]
AQSVANSPSAPPHEIKARSEHRTCLHRSASRQFFRRPLRRGSMALHTTCFMRTHFMIAALSSTMADFSCANFHVVLHKLTPTRFLRTKKTAFNAIEERNSDPRAETELRSEWARRFKHKRAEATDNNNSPCSASRVHTEAIPPRLHASRFTAFLPHLLRSLSAVVRWTHVGPGTRWPLQQAPDTHRSFPDKMGTLRGNRGLGPGCYGALENVGGGAGPVVLLHRARWPVWRRRGLQEAPRTKMRFVAFCCVTAEPISGEYSEAGTWGLRPVVGGGPAGHQRAAAPPHITTLSVAARK